MNVRTVPYRLFHSLEPHSPSIDISELRKIDRSTDFEGLNEIVKGSVG